MIPQLGTFIRPVGEYKYCLELVAVIHGDDQTPDQWQLRRHGINEDDQPFDDGNGHHIFYLTGLIIASPGVFKDISCIWSHVPTYYKIMDLHGQQDLFAA